LATGSYDGTARLWTLSGTSAGMLTGHSGPIFSLRWTTDAKYILSGGVDRRSVLLFIGRFLFLTFCVASARIWDVKTGKELKRFNVHSAPTLDVAWKDNTSFSTCSSDKTVTFCRWDREDPIHRWQEHEDEVNAVVWEPATPGGAGGQDVKYLASCSDDKVGILELLFFHGLGVLLCSDNQNLDSWRDKVCCDVCWTRARNLHCALASWIQNRYSVWTFVLCFC